jgi:hypothetical protein
MGAPDDEAGGSHGSDPVIDNHRDVARTRQLPALRRAQPVTPSQSLLKVHAGHCERVASTYVAVPQP